MSHEAARECTTVNKHVDRRQVYDSNVLLPSSLCTPNRNVCVDVHILYIEIDVDLHRPKVDERE